MTMTFVFEQMRVGGDRNFGYLVGDRGQGKACLIDPSYSPDALVQRAEAQKMQVEMIVNTHGHGDHTNGNAEAKKRTGAKVAAFAESSIQPDVGLRDGQILHIGSITIKVLHTPGHSPDHIVLYLPSYGIALTGDHLFVGKVGGTMTNKAAEQQFASLRRITEELPEHTTVWAGHDVGARPSSTIGWEKKTNPFLLAEDLDAFIERKNRWSEFKMQYGLI